MAGPKWLSVTEIGASALGTGGMCLQIKRSSGSKSWNLNKKKSKPKSLFGEGSKAQTDLPKVTLLLTSFFFPPQESYKCCFIAGLIMETL